MRAGLGAIDTGGGRREPAQGAGPKAVTALIDAPRPGPRRARGRRGLGGGHRRRRVAPGRTRSTSIGSWPALWDKRTAVLTSATIPLRLPERLGLPDDRTDELDVGSPFDYEEQALLYCAAHLPDPRHAVFPGGHLELAALIEAAGGRTLALFTSFRAMQAAADALRLEAAYTLLTQRDLPKPALLAAFPDDATCLFATMGSSGRASTCPAVPEPGRDRPHPVPPARRAAAPSPPRARGRRAFGLIDLPRAATLLAQGAGRLIRSPPTAASWPCSTPGWPRPATAGTWCGPAADAPHQGPRRGRGLPPRDRRALRPRTEVSKPRTEAAD